MFSWKPKRQPKVCYTGGWDVDWITKGNYVHFPQSYWEQLQIPLTISSTIPQKKRIIIIGSLITVIASNYIIPINLISGTAYTHGQQHLQQYSTH